MDAVEMIQGARALIEERGWTGGTREKQGQLCVLGALCKAGSDFSPTSPEGMRFTRTDPVCLEAVEALSTTIPIPLHPSGTLRESQTRLWTYNDSYCDQEKCIAWMRDAEEYLKALKREMVLA